MRLFNDLFMVILFCGISLPAYAQQPQPVTTPRPDTPFSTKPSSEEQYAAAEQQLKAMQEIHQRMMNAKTPHERRALMGEHGRVMRNGLATMEGMRRGAVERGAGMGHGGGMAGHHMHQQLAMMQMMMQMMLDRIDLLSEPTK